MNQILPRDAGVLREAYGAYFAIHGKGGAVPAMADDYACTPDTVYRHLAAAGIREVRPKTGRPSEDRLRDRYETAVEEHGIRAAMGVLAAEYGVTYVTARQWLLDYGLRMPRPRTASPKPIAGLCPCGEAAIARYRSDGPPLCNNCYQLRRAADPGAKSRYGRDYVIETKTGKPCTDCGGYFPTCCLQWDHVPERGPKLFEIGRGDFSIAKIKAEIAKCDLVCANCHVVRTWNRKHPEAPVSLEPIPGGSAVTAVAADGVLF
jgi:hypothetical protein